MTFEVVAGKPYYAIYLPNQRFSMDGSMSGPVHAL